MRETGRRDRDREKDVEGEGGGEIERECSRRYRDR